MERELIIVPKATQMARREAVTRVFIGWLGQGGGELESRMPAKLSELCDGVMGDVGRSDGVME